jgi:hypothetical protein
VIFQRGRAQYIAALLEICLKMKKYLQMTKTERELIVKLIWCTVFSTLFSWAVGDLYSPTTAVTANLVLYIDRGYRGSLQSRINTKSDLNKNHKRFGTLVLKRFFVSRLKPAVNAHTKEKRW